MTSRNFEVERLRLDFPILQQTVQNQPLVYLDNAASTQKPRAVLAAMQNFYTQSYSNVHRGVYTLSAQATEQFEAVRQKVQQFIHAKAAEEIVFLRGTTEAINLVAQSYARPRLGPGDEILISQMEHHSNIVPWQLVCEQTGAQLKVIPLTDTGELCLESAARLLGPRTRLLAVVHLSNALGTLNPVQQLIQMAHEQHIPVLLDGAQAVAHLPIDVQALDCDFYAFSAHKLYGPTGIGVLYGKAKWLNEMPPWQGGGDMIRQVRFEKTDYQDPPHRFEAGTPAIVEVIGLGETIDYLSRLDFTAVMAHETHLLHYATQQLAEIAQLRLIGTAAEKAAVVSFVLDDIHAHDVATILDSEGIAVRAGHHCAMPLMDYFQVPATIRASFACYNTVAEIDHLITSLQKVRKLLG